MVGSTVAAVNQGDCDDHRNEQRSRHRHRARVQPWRPSYGSRPPQRSCCRSPISGSTGSSASRSSPWPSSSPSVCSSTSPNGEPDRCCSRRRACCSWSSTSPSSSSTVALRGHRRNVHHRFGTRRRAQPSRSPQPSRRSAHTATRRDRSTRRSVVAIGLCGVGRRRRRTPSPLRMDIENVQPGPGDVVVDVSDGPPTAPNVDLPAGPNVRRLPQPRRQPAAHRVDRRTSADRRSQPTTAGASTLDLDDGTYRYTIDGPDKRITGTLTVS